MNEAVCRTVLHGLGRNMCRGLRREGVPARKDREATWQRQERPGRVRTEVFTALILRRRYGAAGTDEDRKRMRLNLTEEQRALILRRNIALIGFMGAGKTTISRALRDALGMTEADTDGEIVSREGMPITQIFAQKGESYFRSVETQVICGLQERTGLVISCGGGVAMRQENVDALRKGSRIVLLTAAPETILERVKDSTDRPLLNGHMNVEYIAQLMEVRRPKYEAAADLTVATDGKSAQQIVKEIVQEILETELTELPGGEG